MARITKADTYLCLMGKWQKIRNSYSFKIIVNKYFIVVVFFLVWMTFFDRYNLRNLSDYQNELNELRTKKEYYVEQIEQNTFTQKALKNDMRYLEKFAREKYLMKRDNEDIFLIVKE